MLQLQTHNSDKPGEVPSVRVGVIQMLMIFALLPTGSKDEPALQGNSEEQLTGSFRM